MARQPKTRHYGPAMGQSVKCERCHKQMPLKGGDWVINGHGNLLCFGTEESCFEKVYKLRSYSDRKGSADTAKGQE